ncbi:MULTISPECIES: hypothetical protein [Streptomyces]|uniref:hypothetical protein n=1 Tax=Streptomyces TaxID=1883 RepID=UPI00069AFEF6|nr:MULTISPECIES: hypothetical protein [Streptomyces]MYU56846.1 hypothetical protein [Streptomyces sp. SID7805]
MPESAGREEIRLRIRGTDNPQQDLADLTAWLEREPWLRRRQHLWETRPPHETEADDGAGDGPRDMAVGVDDLILVVVGAVAGEITKSLTFALREWLRRRREERAAGEEPALSVGDDGGLRPVGDAGPHGAAPGHPDPGSPAHEGGSTGED